MNSTFFGCTDLWISPSRPKFDEEVDFEVRLVVAPRKPKQTDEKRNFRSAMFDDFVCPTSKNVRKNKRLGIVRKAFWQSFASIGAMFEELANIITSLWTGRN